VAFLADWPHWRPGNCSKPNRRRELQRIPADLRVIARFHKHLRGQPAIRTPL
jgi:hypothetical protein